MSSKAHYRSMMNKHIRPNLLKDYGPIDGMEGPFQFPNGRVLYYDKRENGGTYYDRGRDMYIYDQRELDQIMRTASLMRKAYQLRQANRDLKRKLDSLTSQYDKYEGEKFVQDDEDLNSILSNTDQLVRDAQVKYKEMMKAVSNAEESLRDAEEDLKSFEGEYQKKKRGKKASAYDSQVEDALKFLPTDSGRASLSDRAVNNMRDVYEGIISRKVDKEYQDRVEALEAQVSALNSEVESAKREAYRSINRDLSTLIGYFSSTAINTPATGDGLRKFMKARVKTPAHIRDTRQLRYHIFFHFMSRGMLQGLELYR